MRNKLLAAVALCAATSSTMPLWAAVNVDEPQLGSTVAFDEAEGGSYYIYNLGAKMFLTAGNEYGTQASLGETGYKISVKQITDASTKLSGWVLEYPSSAPGNNGGKPKYMYIVNNGFKAYVDYNLSGSYLWKIVKGDGDTYRISIIDDDPSNGANITGATTYVGQVNNDLTAEGIDNTVVNPLINPDTYGAADQQKLNLDWAFVTPEAYDIFNAKKELYAALERADKEGFTDVASYETIYNSETSTAEEIVAAAEELEEATDNYIYSQATPENPVDLTSKIKSPSFVDADGNRTTSGWSMVDMGMDQNREGDDYYLVEGSDRAIDDFVEKWVDSSNVLYYSSIWQGIEGLPAGKYSLSVDVVATRQNAPEQESKGVYITTDGGLGETLTEIKMANFDGKARTFSTEFNIADSANFVFGVRVQNSNINWVMVDNFRLTYYGPLGEVEMAKEELQKTITASEEYISEVDGNGLIYSFPRREKFDEIIALAKEGYENASIDADSVVALRNMVQAQKDSLAYDVEFYGGTQFSDKINEFYNRIYDNPLYIDDEFFFTESEAYLVSQEELFGAQMFDPYNFGEMQEVADSLYRKDIFEALKNGITTNATGLVQSYNFDNDSKTGWNGNPSVSWGIGEIYNGTSYNVYQTLENLPAGTYRIKMNGFYRPGTNDVCANGDEETNKVYSFLYGNEASAEIKHLYSEEGLFSEPPLTNDDGSPRGCTQLVSTNPDLNGKYVINDRECMSKVLESNPELYTNEVVCFVGEDGKLTFGVKNIGTPANINNWTTFDNFIVTYDANDLTGYVNSVASLVAKADEIISSSSITSMDDPTNVAVLPLDVDAALSSARDAANSEIIGGSDFTAEDAVAHVNKLTEVIALADSALVRSGILVNEYALALERTGVMESDYAGYAECMYDYETKAMEGFASIDEVNEWIVKFKTEYTNFAIYGKTEGASKDAPVELTDAIVNSGFEKTDVASGEKEYTAEGWENPGTANYSEVEFYNTDFNMYQEIHGLPAGYYRVEVNGYYREGDYRPAAARYRDGIDTLNAFVYVEGAASDYAVALKSIFEDATDAPTASENVNVGDSLYTGDNIDDAPAKYIPNHMNDAQGAFEENLYVNELYFKIDEGQSMIRLGVRKDKLVTNDWTIFDTFRLYYYGAGDENMPDGVGEVTDGKAVVVSSAYYTVGGVQVSKPSQRGLYIREDLMSDGSKRTVKVMIR